MKWRALRLPKLTAEEKRDRRGELTLCEAAVFLGMSRYRVYKLARIGNIPCHQRTWRGRRLFLEDELLQWMKDGSAFYK